MSLLTPRFRPCRDGGALRAVRAPAPRWLLLFASTYACACLGCLAGAATARAKVPSSAAGAAAQPVPTHTTAGQPAGRRSERRA